MCCYNPTNGVRAISLIFQRFDHFGKYTSHGFVKGFSTTKLLFLGTSYSYWKVELRYFQKSKAHAIWTMVEKWYSPPIIEGVEISKSKHKWDENEMKWTN